MTRLPACSGLKVAKAFSGIGYKLDHQTGSHMILRHSVSGRRLVIPNHPELAKGNLRSIIRESGLSKEEFETLLRS